MALESKQMPKPESLLKTQFSLAFDAFHAAEKKGLFNLKLKDCLASSPLHQRRQLKRSTSSNASSESNLSNNSISSGISTSNTSLSTFSQRYIKAPESLLHCYHSYLFIWRYVKKENCVIWVWFLNRVLSVSKSKKLSSVK